MSQITSSKKVLHICLNAASFKPLPQTFNQNWKEIKLSNNFSNHPDIFCQLNDFKLLTHQSYDAIWMPQGFNTLYLKDLKAFIQNAFNMLNDQGEFCFFIPNIKEVARLNYQTTPERIIPQLGLSPKELTYGSTSEIDKFGDKATVKQAFSQHALVELFKNSRFAKIEINDRRLYFTVKATKVLSSSGFDIKVLNDDINLRIAMRDKLDQPTNLPVQYKNS